MLYTDQPILDFEGKPIIEVGQTEPMTMFAAIFFCLRNLDSGDKLRAFHLSIQLAAKPETIELTPEDVVLIKPLAERLLTVLSYGRLLEFFNQVPVPQNDTNVNAELDNK